MPDADRRRCRTDAVADPRAGWHLALEDRAATRLLPLARPIVRVGRGAHCELRIDHPSVAVEHAVLAVRREGPLLFAEPTAGRTAVNGRRVDERTRLADYDIVVFGDVMAVVRWIPDGHWRHRPSQPAASMWLS